MQSQKKLIVNSDKGGARFGAGRPSVSSEWHKVYLGTGTEVQQAHYRLKDAEEIYRVQVPLPDKAAVP